MAHFSASWCIPSVAMNPVFEELSLTFPDAVFLVVDVDDVKVKQIIVLSSVMLITAPFFLHCVPP